MRPGEPWTPNSILLFEISGYFSLLLGLTSEAINWPLLKPIYDRSPQAFLVAQILVFGGQLLTILAIAHGRDYLLRLIWITSPYFWVMGVFQQVATHLTSPGPSLSAFTPGGRLEILLIDAAHVGMAFCLFTPSAREWFRQPD